MNEDFQNTNKEGDEASFLCWWLYSIPKNFPCCLLVLTELFTLKIHIFLVHEKKHRKVNSYFLLEFTDKRKRCQNIFSSTSKIICWSWMVQINIQIFHYTKYAQYNSRAISLHPTETSVCFDVLWLSLK